MSAPSIFVSYSHKDPKALAELKKFFKPLERESIAKLWADTGIDYGASWDHEISAALRACQYVVPVLSANFFASDYIAEREIPLMLEREAAGDLKIVPIFWSPAAEPEFEQIFPSGERKQRKLSDWQGLATKEKPMIALERVPRERELVKWIEWLRLQVGKPTKPAKSVIASVLPAKEEGRVPLSIELDRQGDDLYVRYRQPGQGPLEPRRLAWSAVVQEVREIHAALDNFRRDSLETWVAEAKSGAGAKLLEILFGGEESWVPLLSRIFGRNQATFTMRPVDLRIVARERDLAALPWRLLAYRNKFLTADGWTMATARDVDPTAAVQTLPHGEILIAAAGEDGGLADKLALFLREAWSIQEGDPRLQVCRTAKGLRVALRFMAPHLVVVTGQAGKAELHFADARVPCRELEGAAETKIFVLACRGLASFEPGALGVCMLWPRFDELGPDWATQLLTFFQKWLLDGKDPVFAFHEIEDGVDRGTFRLLADYRTWQVLRETKVARNVKDLLDRIDQKARVLRECQQLAKPGSPRKVLVLIAHAGPGDGVAHHSDQLIHVIETEAHQLPVNKVKLEIPQVRQDLRRDLENLLRQVVEVPANTTQALRSLGPRKTGENVPLVWLDCGCVAGSEFSRDELIRWIAFADECLLPNCPENLRLVIYLGLHFDAESIEGASESLAELGGSTPVQLGTVLVVLPRLHEVPVKELSDFLREHGCPEPLRAAELIHAKTKGKFDATVQQIEQGQKGWLTLIAELEKQQPPPKPKRKGW